MQMHGIGSAGVHMYALIAKLCRTHTYHHPQRGCFVG